MPTTMTLTDAIRHLIDTAMAEHDAALAVDDLLEAARTLVTEEWLRGQLKAAKEADAAGGAGGRR